MCNISYLHFYKNRIVTPSHRKYGYNRDLSSYGGDRSAKFEDFTEIKFVINDRFCICNFIAMKKYCEFGKYDKTIFNFTKSYGGHSSTESGMSFHLFLQNIDVYDDPDLNTNIIRN